MVKLDKMHVLNEQFNLQCQTNAVQS